MTTAKELIEQVMKLEANPVKIANARGMLKDPAQGKGGWVFNFANSSSAKLAKKDLEKSGFKVSEGFFLHVRS